jgi:DNA-binding CsgD family transcriptional regulator
VNREAPAVPEPTAALLGRERELELLVRLVDSVGRQGQALLIGGDAGIGKTSLLAEASREATSKGFQVLSAWGMETEANLPFAALHQLLRPVLKEADRLPAPQRSALLAAFGMVDAAAPDLFFTALAALNLLADVAADKPLLLVCDDAQWFDRPSGDALSFIARRLGSDPIALLAAIRHGHDSPLLHAGLPEMELSTLGNETAKRLLQARAPDLPSLRRDQVLKLADGNPLALMELPAALVDDPTPLGSPFPARLAFTAPLERAFAGRAASLPAKTATLLLIAAADDDREYAEVLRAGSLVNASDCNLDDLAPAISANLVEIDGNELHFRHPLVRSAIYNHATASEHQAAHRALAQVLEGQPDRQAWHRSEAAAGPDEDVALALDQAASRAERRGGVSVAVAALQRAAALGDPPRRADRLLRAAELAFQIGRQDLVERLLADVEPLELSWRERGLAAWIRDSFDDGVPGDPIQVRSLTEVADEARVAGDTDLALKLLLGAALRTWWADPGPEWRGQVITIAERVKVPESDPRMLAILAVAAPDRRSPLVLERLSRVGHPDLSRPEAGWLLGMAAHAIGDSVVSDGLLTCAADGLRLQGKLALLAQVLSMKAWGAVELGNWRLAQTAAEEGERLARETGQPIWIAGATIALAIAAGVRGERQRAESLADEAERSILPRHLGNLLAVLELTRGLTALTAGDHGEAYEHLRRMLDPNDPAYHLRERYRALVYFAQAAALSGRAEEARGILDDFESLAAQTQSPYLRLSVLYARPFLADQGAAAALFEAALGADASHWPFFRALVQLAYGTLLRRQRRSLEARVPLRAAIEVFDGLGALPWGERARQELRASGEATGHRALNVRDELTAQEFQIAEMAADGLSNREIGERLFLSPRTVGTHLYRVFPKLGITSRTQLHRVLARPA